MRTFAYLLMCLCIGYTSLAQQPTPSENELINQGTALHDKQDYEGAIKLYDEVIAKNPKNLLAWYEKSYSLVAWEKYQECVDCCKEVIKKFPKGEEVAKVYGNLGTAYDNLHKPDEAIKAYSEGIKLSPNSYLLYFNRGITEQAQKDIKGAIADFKKSVSLHPLHASSHQYLAYCIYKENRVAAVMALSVFLLIEPTGQRAEKNLKLLSQMLGANVEQKDEKNISITLSEADLKATKKEDDFHITDMTLTMNAALDFDEKSKDLDVAEKLEKKLDILGVIGTEKSQKGFFSNFYVPFFKELRDQKFLTPAAYIMYATGEDKAVIEWLKENQAKTGALYAWMEKYQWPKID